MGMSFEPDLLFDRRRLKRRLTVWRLVALASLAALVVVLADRLDGDHGLLGGDHVARLDIDGVIFQDRARLDAIAALAESSRAKAVILHIDSPGGTFGGGESLYHALRALAMEKPTVAVLGGTATSAGYMVAIAADHIVGRAGTLTGSIGVILQTADVTGLLERLGVQPETFKSGPMKAQPNPLETLSDDARAATQGVVADLHAQFVDMVVERRGLPPDALADLGNGRVLSGRAAKQSGLIDAIGGEAEARAWLASQHGIAHDLPISDWTASDNIGSWRDALTRHIQKALFSERLRLDGVFSLWHPSL